MRIVTLAAAALLLAACSESGASTAAQDANAAATNAVATAAPEPPPPTHRWTYREGREYGYEAAISEDAKSAGTAASVVHMYRFLGEKDGVYTIATHDGEMSAVMSCTTPCEVMKIHMTNPFGSQTERVAFAPESIAGAAMTDAMSGQMEVYGAQEEAAAAN